MSCCSHRNNNEKAQVIAGKLCYCFHYFEDDFKKAIAEDREDEIVNAIKLKMKDPGCFCSTANPSGKCCLSSIMAFIESHSS